MKRKFLDIIESLKEAGSEVVRLIKKNQIEGIQSILVDMQGLAIGLGNYIEKWEGNGTETVTLLEEYCELVWQCSTAEKAEDALFLYEKIEQSMGKIKRAIQEEILDKKEIVFFPYKASMWDSLESIWLAAKEKKEYRVYVVPIPYYEKNSNGSFGKECYEGKEFPDYVDVISWKEYSVQERKPDIVFIHNPYDNGNHVSSVHPEYYAKNLKKYTNMLVYIPYFVLGEDIYENFCVCAGTIYAHKVIVQSEKVRGVYVRCFKEFVRENHLEVLFSEEVIEEKFVALGSPKIDKALNSKKEDYQLPETWKKLLEGKKAVLYNTGISGILNGNEQELEKIEDVLTCFREREDVVLWWRPHPLSKSACVSLRPQLYEKYQQMVESYKQEGFGIYDDTADLYRAVTYTDMYYGDESSLVYLYGVQGKPIVVQNIYYLCNNEEDKKERSLCFDDCVYENGMIWFVVNNYNGLFQMNVETGETEYLGNIPGEVSAARHLYSRIFKDGEYLWLIPSMAKEIARYHINTGEFMKYPLLEGTRGKEPRFQYAYLWEKQIYMVSGDYKKLVVFHTKKGTMTVEENFLGNVGQKYKVCRGGAFPSMCMVGNKLYFVINDTSVVVEYDTTTKKNTMYTVGKTVNKYMDIEYDGTYFWLIPCIEGKIIRWDKKNQVIQEIEEYPKEFQHSFLFRSACCQGGFLWVFPARGNMILKINTSTLEMSMVHVKDYKYDVYFAKKTEDERILFSTRISSSKHTLYLLENGMVSNNQRAIREPKNYQRKNMQVFAKMGSEQYESERGYYIYESREYSIKEILNQMEQGKNSFQLEKECFLEMLGNSKGDAGKNILNYICSGKEKNDFKK